VNLDIDIGDEMRTIGLDFDAVVHAGDIRDMCLQDDVFKGLPEFLVRNITMCNIKIISPRLLKWGQRARMHAWMRQQLLQWIRRPGSITIALMNDPVLHMAININRIHRDHDEYEHYILEWADSIVNQICWTWYRGHVDVMMDDRALASDGVWEG
jgi:hypothetical protein